MLNWVIKIVDIERFWRTKIVLSWDTTYYVDSSEAVKYEVCKAQSVLLYLILERPYEEILMEIQFCAEERSMPLESTSLGFEYKNY